MSYNPNWNRWIRASVVEHFKAALEAAAIPYFIEGLIDRPAAGTQLVEIRMDGPFSEEHSKNDYTLRIEVNLLIQTTIDKTVNLYQHEENLGVCQAAFTCIPVYQFGDDPDVQIGSLKLDSDRPRDNLKASDFGQIGKDTKLRQATVEGHYNIELEGS